LRRALICLEQINLFHSILVHYLFYISQLE
jgi:hypothetical protein